MHQAFKFLLTSVALGAFITGLLPTSVSGQESETTVETRAFGGVKEANVFAPKYKERIQTYSEQIEMGSTKGWLTPAEVDQFSKRLDEMRKMESDAASKGWTRADIDAVEKVFQKFNIDLTAAANKAPAESETTTPAAKPPVSSASEKATSTADGGAAVSSSNKKSTSKVKKSPSKATPKKSAK